MSAVCTGNATRLRQGAPGIQYLELGLTFHQSFGRLVYCAHFDFYNQIAGNNSMCAGLGLRRMLALEPLKVRGFQFRAGYRPCRRLFHLD